MNKIQDINEATIFVQNLANIIGHLKLNKSKFNSKLGWSTNKLSNILLRGQEPLINDARQVRILLGLTTADLLTRLLSWEEIDRLEEKLNDVKLTRSRSQTTRIGEAISYIIVLLQKAYNQNKEFTKKDILDSLPKEFSDYSIEWKKTRLKEYIRKVGKRINSENKSEHVFKLIKDLPTDMVKKAREKVGDEWLDD